MKKFLALFLVLVLALGMFAGCGKDPAKTPDEPKEPEIQRTPEEQILWDRRVTAENYLRTLAKIRWRADEDIVYSHNSEPGRWKIVAGRLYEGLPYSYAGATLGSWTDHSSGVDKDGVYDMSELSFDLLNGSSHSSRLGIDCSGTLSHSWQAAGANIRTESTNAMTPANGYLKVGEYEAPEDNYESTKADCLRNGTDVMCEAYAKLQKADALVTSNGNGHAQFVVGVNVVRYDDGKINAAQSTITVIEQNGLMGSGKYYVDEATGEKVYECITVDKEYTFMSHILSGYLPVTNKIFIDPSPIEDPVATDTVKEPTIANLFSGTIKCNWALDNVTITITDASGAVVQSSILHPQRRTEMGVSMAQFSADAAANKTMGVVNPMTLAAGSYHCKVTCRTVAGHEMTVREFDFTM